METDTGQEIVSPVDRTSYEAHQTLAQQLSSEFSLQIILDNIKKVTCADLIISYLYDRASQSFQLPPYISGTLLDPGTYQAMYPVQHHMLSDLILHTEPIFANKSETLHSLQHDDAIADFYQRELVHSTVVVPLYLEGELVGVLFIHFRQTQQFELSQRRLVENLACYAAISINVSQTLHTLSEGRIHELAILQSIDRELYTNVELTEILPTMFEFVVHGLGNSLGLVGYYVNTIQEELQMRGVVSEPISEKLRLIDLSTSSVLNLSNQLKQKVVHTATEIQAEPHLFHPQALLEEALGEIAVPANIRVYRQIEPDAAEILVYPRPVVHSLHNLIMNAIQAMPKGGELTCSIYNRGPSVVFEVKDTGIGIPLERHTEIFKLFYSTKNSSGFGLWSAQRSALKNRGKLELQRSILGSGTTFVLFFPREGVYEQ
jgi:signal transduction histidine kinase